MDFPPCKGRALVATAYVLINVPNGTEGVRRALKRIPEIKEAYSVNGVYDILIRLEANTMEEIKSTISLRIQHIKGIRSTTTMIVAQL